MPRKIGIKGLIGLCALALLWGFFPHAADEVEEPVVEIKEPLAPIVSPIVHVAEDYEKRIEVLEESVVLLSDAVGEIRAVVSELRDHQLKSSDQVGLKSSFSKEQLQEIVYENADMGEDSDAVPYRAAVMAKYKTKEEALNALGFSIEEDSFELSGQKFDSND